MDNEIEFYKSYQVMLRAMAIRYMDLVSLLPEGEEQMLMAQITEEESPNPTSARDIISMSRQVAVYWDEKGKQ